MLISIKKLIAIFLVFQFSTSAALAASAPEVRVVKRKILALYDGAKFSDNRDTFIHKFAEMPLNHVGYDVRFHDVRTGFPKLSSLADYRGVMTWFVGALDNGEDYLRWAEEAARYGLKFLVMNDIGVKVSEIGRAHV